MKCSEAGTGGEGLELIDSVNIDALILDVNLPDMSGFDIVRKLRAEAVTALLPVIHVSAASIQTGDIITGLERRCRCLPDSPGGPGCVAGHPAHLAARAGNRKCPA